MTKPNFPVPTEIPGQLITDPQRLNELKNHLADLCHLDNIRFPGSQPVSFDRESMRLLERENFWVCEKSDGVRVLVLIVSTELGQEIYLIDRKEDFYQNYGLTFPHQDGPNFNHSNTVLDGELVYDLIPSESQDEDGNGNIGGMDKVLRLLAFDLLVCDSENLMMKPLSSRYGRLKSWVIEPYDQKLIAQPELKHYQPFEVLLKVQELAYGIEAVFKEHVPNLKHGNDGLIFTSAEAPYTPGTDYKILKWKPPSENSIDFLLRLKFPSLSKERPDECDWSQKPWFMLFMNHGHEGTHYFDTMEVEDDVWEEWKESGEQYDDRVVEVVWDKGRDTWQMLRFRDDKYEGNYKTVVQSIIKSIQHGVEADTLISHAGKIKHFWRVRAAEAAELAARQAKEAQLTKERQKNKNGNNGNNNNGGGGGISNNGVSKAMISGGLKR